MKLENAFRCCVFNYAERVGSGAVLFNGRAGNDGNVTFDLVEEIGECPGGLGFVREGALNDHVLAGIAQDQLMGTAGEIRDRLPVLAVRYGPGEENLVVRLRDAILVNEYEFRDQRARLQQPVSVKIRNITHDEVVRVERDRVALLDEPPEVVVMTDQSLKH